MRSPLFRHPAARLRSLGCVRACVRACGAVWFSLLTLLSSRESGGLLWRLGYARSSARPPVVHPPLQKCRRTMQSIWRDTARKYGVALSSAPLIPFRSLFARGTRCTHTFLPPGARAWRSLAQTLTADWTTQVWGQHRLFVECSSVRSRRCLFADVLGASPLR